MFANSLIAIVVLLSFVVFFGYINEKTIKIADEIALMLFAFICGVIILIGLVISDNFDVTTSAATNLINYVESLNFEGFLMNGVLCFMLFAGTTGIKRKELNKYFKLTGLLSLWTTFLGVMFYGLMFFGITFILKLDIPLLVCLVLGCVVAPTDPIAATSILKKFNLPHDTSIVLQGESLFNDGVGVALFVCILGAATHSSEANFFVVMARELLGAIIIGYAVSYILFIFFKDTSDQHRKIAISLLAVSLCYVLCEHFECSGPIASVVCGIFFSSKIDHDIRHHDLDIPAYHYFWEVLDGLLNSILYVMIGFAFPAVIHMQDGWLLAVAAIVINTIARAASATMSCIISKPLPDNYTLKKFVTLLTWGGMKGGLCLAMALSLKEVFDPNVYYIMLGATYSIVFFTTIIQGLTMPKVYEKCKVE